jgi:hypothetical protein
MRAVRRLPLTFLGSRASFGTPQTFCPVTTEFVRDEIDHPARSLFATWGRQNTPSAYPSKGTIEVSAKG